jgi:hypothetical protein
MPYVSAHARILAPSLASKLLNEFYLVFRSSSVTGRCPVNTSSRNRSPSVELQKEQNCDFLENGCRLLPLTEVCEWYLQENSGTLKCLRNACMS